MSRLIVNTIRPVTGSFTDVMDLGQGQQWFNMNAERAPNVLYTNTTGRPIMVSIVETGNTNASLSIDGLTILRAEGANADTTLTTIVSPDSTYIFQGVFLHWSELR